MRVQAQVSLYPLRTEKLSGPVERFCRVLRSHGLRIEMGSMSTFITGESKELFDALKEGFEALAQRNEIVIDCKISNACPDRVENKCEKIERLD